MLKILDNNRYLNLRLAIIFIMAGLLVYYHVFTLYDLHWVGNTSEAHQFTFIQSIIRACIASSLIGVMCGWRKALWGMWISITALTITRYMLLYTTTPASEVEIGELFSYLRGFIFPTVITLLYPDFGWSKKTAKGTSME